MHSLLLLLALASADSRGPFDGLRFREIGPASAGGRIDDFAVLESNPDVFYVATSTGGLWKTENNGTTFEVQFDRETTSSIGDVAIAPEDPNLVWVGTGENNNRQSSSWGDGIYKSTDGGKTWRNMGLAKSRHIARIVVDPERPRRGLRRRARKPLGARRRARGLQDDGRRGELEPRPSRG